MSWTSVPSERRGVLRQFSTASSRRLLRFFVSRPCALMPTTKLGFYWIVQRSPPRNCWKSCSPSRSGDISFSKALGLCGWKAEVARAAKCMHCNSWQVFPLFPWFFPAPSLHPPFSVSVHLSQFFDQLAGFEKMSVTFFPEDPYTNMCRTCTRTWLERPAEQEKEIVRGFFPDCRRCTSTVLMAVLISWLCKGVFARCVEIYASRRCLQACRCLVREACMVDYVSWLINSTMPSFPQVLGSF